MLVGRSVRSAVAGFFESHFDWIENIISAMIPARTAANGRSVAQGMSIFRLSLSAMTACACYTPQKIGRR